VDGGFSGVRGEQGVSAREHREPVWRRGIVEGDLAFDRACGLWVAWVTWVTTRRRRRWAGGGFGGMHNWSESLSVRVRVRMRVNLMDRVPAAAQPPHKQRRLRPRKRRVRVARTEGGSRATLPALGLVLALKALPPPRLAHPEPVVQRAHRGPAAVLRRERVHVLRVVPPLVGHPPGLVAAVQVRVWVRAQGSSNGGKRRVQ
jgi:hypothetical protein